MAKQQSNHKVIIKGIAIITFSVLILLSLLTYSTTDYSPDSTLFENKDIQNVIGPAGAYISYYLIQHTFGYAVVIAFILTILWGWQVIRQKPNPWLKRFSKYSLLSMLLISYGLAIIREFSIGGSQYHYEQSGLIGGFFANYSSIFFGQTGTIIIYIALVSILMIMWTKLKFWVLIENFEKEAIKKWNKRDNLYKVIKDFFNEQKDSFMSSEHDNEKIKQKPKITKRPPIERVKKPIEKIENQDIQTEIETKIDPVPEDPKENPLDKYYRKPESNKKRNGIIIENEVDLTSNKSKKSESDILGDYEPGIYKIPHTGLLNELPEDTEENIDVSEDYINQKAEILETTLKDFGVNAKVVKVHPGPVLTLYEVKPDVGVKISKISSLEDDIALSMKARGIRIIAPIPGKNTVGIELPNLNPKTIYLRDLLEDKEFDKCKSKLTVALGRTTTGEVFYADLATMPHLLVAGQTGAGKSVGINTIIASILFKATPQEVQFVLVDPKMVELSIFKKLKGHHLLTADFIDEDVITQPANAVLILNAIVEEMNKRYKILARNNVRNITDYNNKKKVPDPVTGETDPDKFEYIVVIVDEFADLMMVAQKEVEEPIARIAQMARAVGIHLILATQRPSVDVITGFIKSNFPARIAYSVFSKTDSRTILDFNGAETLLGKGDMLFQPPGSPQPVRIQNAFLSTEEVEKVVDYVASQPKFAKITELTLNSKSSHGTGSSDHPSGDRDSLFDEAARVVVTHQQGSISLLQRKLKIGYSRGARLVDELEEAGIVGPYDGSKGRQVIIGIEDIDDYI